MSLKDVLIMEVPSGAIKKVLKDKKVNAKLNSLEEMANALTKNLPDDSKKLSDEYKFAGSTSVNLNIMMKGIPHEWHNRDYFIKHLNAKYSTDIFNKGIKPNLDDTPKLIRAYKHQDKLVLAFSFFGPPRRVLEDFQIVVRKPQFVEYVIVHFSPFSIEIRSSPDRNILFRDAVLDIMDIKEKDNVVWDRVTKLTDPQANELAQKLGAKLRAAKHKMTAGVYATKEVTANTQVDDLESTEEYKKEFNNQPMKKKTLIFDFTYSFGYTETVSYVITDAGLWIRSKSGEEVISYILDQIIQIRYPSDIDNLENLDEEDSFIEQTEVEELIDESYKEKRNA